MLKSNSKECTTLLFSCCGASDVGEIADKAARKLARDGIGKFYCLSGIGAGLDNFINNTKAAAKVLVIDGCQFDCARICLEKNGIFDFDYIRVTDTGLEKGKSDVNDQNIERITSRCSDILIKSKCP